ncbi:aldo/keto reductase [Candidatus Fermentibacterales bacterium]|nr:aldo/keto reductase [Candidatus Fermentibacterales bacterium]
MRYRSFGSEEWHPSALGFGAMRLPLLKPGSPSSIDEDLSSAMLDYAIDHGVNLLDTAYPYHAGESERFLGRYLERRRPGHVLLSTKLPSWKIESRDDMDRFFEEQLARLRRDSFDIYLLHGLDHQSWEKLSGLGVLDWAARRMADGEISRLGFSFHDGPEDFRHIIDAWDGWSCCMLQYNYMDVDRQAGADGVRYAASRGIAVIAMEPLRGGQLSRRPPEGVRRLWEASARRMSAVEWALQWVWDQPEVSLLLSGMASMEQVRQNVEFACRSGPGTLSDPERGLVAEVRSEYRKLSAIDCTGCGYCLPCPEQILIPYLFDLFNSAYLYDDLDGMRRAYGWIRREARADACTSCGHCESRCPQGLRVPELLARVHERLGSG